MPDTFKILLIDDEKKALDLMKLSLEEYGYDVETASDGQNGLDKAITMKPDLVILDIRMPKLDGWGVCKGLKDNDITCNIPVIILTAYSRPKDIERAENLGVKAYLTKPTNPNTLLWFIEHML